MRHARHLLAVLAFVLCAGLARAEEVASRNIVVNVTVVARTTLEVSSNRLQFDVPRTGGAVTASIDFTAASRMPAGCDVVLTVEPLHGIDGSAELRDADLSFVGHGPGMLAGSIAAGGSTIVGRWQGSGLREGRVVFTLRGPSAGGYSLPIRVVLSTP